MENEIDSNLDALGHAAGRLNALARATGKEVDEQNKHIDVIIQKVTSSPYFPCSMDTRLIQSCRAIAWTIRLQ